MTNRTTVVIGGGVVGASIAWNLRNTSPPGHDVQLLDTHLPLLGATAYSAGILRRHHTLAEDIALAGESIGFYRRFADQVGGSSGYTGQQFLLLLKAESAADASVHRGHIDRFEPASRWLTSAELADRYPYMTIGADEFGVLETDGGYGDATATALSYRAAFVDAGGDLRCGVCVEGIERASGRWRLRTNVDDLAADDLVIAAGWQSAELLAKLDIELPVVARRIGLAVIHGDQAPSSGPVVIDDVTGAYFVPRPNGSVALGVRARPKWDQPLPAQPLSRAEVTEAVRRSSARVSSFAQARVVGSQAACDGYTPDNRPVLGPVPECDGLHLACGFSGGGFKIAPAVGRHVADGVFTGRPPDAIAAYDLRRFARGDQLAPERRYAHL